MLSLIAVSSVAALLVGMAAGWRAAMEMKNREHRKARVQVKRLLATVDDLSTTIAETAEELQHYRALAGRDPYRSGPLDPFDPAESRAMLAPPPPKRLSL